MDGRLAILAFTLLTALAGCADPEIPQREQKPTELAKSFDAATTGTIRGRVLWDGAAPVAEEYLVRANAFNPFLYQNPARYKTPHVPKVNPGMNGVVNAVIYLRGVDPKRSKTWDQPAVRVEFHERRLLIRQGDESSNVGFVRRGCAIEIVNRDTEYHNLHGRGAECFAMPLLERDQVHTRVLPKAAVVDLTCAAGYYWLHAHLFVAEHPYYTRSDADGNFVLDQVPEGKYELVCWLPDWNVVRKEVDPETAVTARLAWAAPKEQSRTIDVRPNAVSPVEYCWSTSMFLDHGKKLP